MPRAKLLWVQSVNLDDGDYKEILRDQTDEFEEISDADLHDLRLHLGYLRHPEGYIAKLVVEDHQTLQERLTSVRQIIKNYKDIEEKAKARREQKKLEKTAAERAHFLALKKKYESE